MFVLGLIAVIATDAAEDVAAVVFPSTSQTFRSPTMKKTRARSRRFSMLKKEGVVASQGRTTPFIVLRV